MKAGNGSQLLWFVETCCPLEEVSKNAKWTDTEPSSSDHSKHLNKFTHSYTNIHSLMEEAAIQSANHLIRI